LWNSVRIDEKVDCERTILAGSRMGEFTIEQARAFYDWFGRRQDWQSFYEDPALEMLIKHGAFRDAHRVIEFGCGTGRLAERLLRDYLPGDAIYLGVDLSQTMVRLAKERLHHWCARAEVRLSDGSAVLGQRDGSADRFVSTYVFDLLSGAQIEQALKQAHRLLAREGLLCLVSATRGRGLISHMICRAWGGIHALSPRLVGGCRPIALTDYINSEWRVLHLDTVSSFGIASQVLVASPQSAD
jgi:SAM-dependent methyltransferase